MLVSDVLPSIGKFVEFFISPIAEIPTASVTSSAFDMLMAGSKRRFLPDKSEAANKKSDLKNDVIDWLENNKLGWSGGCIKSSSSFFVNTLTGVLWDVDRYHKQLANGSHGIPNELKHFIGYNSPEK